MKAEHGGPFLKPQPADRTREALSGMHPEIISAHTESIGSVDRKAKTTCILVLFIFSSFSHVFPVEGSPVLTSLIFIVMFVCLFIVIVHQYGQNRNAHMHLIFTQLQQKQIFKGLAKKGLKTNKIHASIVGDSTLSGGENQRSSLVAIFPDKFFY